jgi:hypothetical protein
MGLKFYETDYQQFIGQPFALLAWHEVGNNLWFERYGILIRDDNSAKIRHETMKYIQDANFKKVFPDFDSFMDKVLIPSSQRFLYHKIIFDEIKDPKTFWPYPSKPVFHELDKQNLGFIMNQNRMKLQQMRKVSTIPELQDFLDLIIPVVYSIEITADELI